MIASVHIADVGAGRALAFIAGSPMRRPIAGLRHANTVVCVPLGGSTLPSPHRGRPAHSQACT